MASDVAPPSANLVRSEAPAIVAHPLVFSGSSAGYARVWLVNVLLNVLTLGLYTPWARRRTALYFYGHTLVAGSPLEFMAQQRRMVLGFFMVAAVYLAWRLATDTGQDVAASVLTLGVAVLTPWLWASAMRFRLSNTRWRGLRLQFQASWRQVYLASWPVFALALVWLGTGWLLARWLGPASPRQAPPVGVWPVLALALVLSVLCVIRLEFNYKSLLVKCARIGNQSGRWKPVYGDFVRIWGATVGVFVLCVLVCVGAVALLGGSLFALIKHHPGAAVLGIVLALAGGLVLLLVASAPARAYREARVFRLVWSNLGVSHIARFKSRLKTRAFVLLRMKNTLLTLLTLGLYRPFMMVSEYRMKLESVTLHVKGGLDQLVGQLAVQEQDGLGDAAAEAVGLDLIG